MGDYVVAAQSRLGDLCELPVIAAYLLGGICADVIEAATGREGILPHAHSQPCVMGAVDVTPFPPG
ncbi:MAG: hypothetical protein IRZ07_06640 [Microbispora sp.]|nr:hypothetical protein [Microbispora sp.]